MRFATMFSGGEGAGVGLRAAGLHHAWGIEHDPAIAAVARVNGFTVHVADVRAVNYAALPHVDWLHASPVCTRASVANSGATESEDDIGMAAAVVRALQAQLPDVFTLENVWQYRKFRAFTGITDALGAMGYFWTYDHVNAADYGVPQIRKRLILRASRGLLPHLPPPVPWVGWYAAIEDLIPTLPESKLAPWQLARLPEELRAHVLVGGGNTQMAQVDSKARQLWEPAFTVTSGVKMGDNREVLFAGDSSADSWGANYRLTDAPAFTTKENGIGKSKALLLDGNNGSTTTGAPIMCDQASPAFTLASARSAQHRAILPARVVAMTPRALARFQSVPDSYTLPDSRTLAAKIIGNMVPPLLMQRIAEGVTA